VPRRSWKLRSPAPALSATTRQLKLKCRFSNAIPVEVVRISGLTLGNLSR
jgi:hypothetical protein